MTDRTCLPLLVTLVLSAPFLNQATAFPNAARQTANSCSVCHATPRELQPPGVSLSGEKDGREVDGKMKVRGIGFLTDLGVQLNGSTRGPLEPFEAPAGSVVRLQVEVLDGFDGHAVQLKRLETGGQQVDASHTLDWADANNTPSLWARQENGDTPFFTSEILGGNPPTVYSFDLFVGPSTPPDFYDLEFAVAGQDGLGLFYQDEHFYLRVTDPVDGAASEWTNMSVRGRVGGDSGNLVAGLVIVGEAPQRLLIRGVGPAMDSLGVPGTLGDPELRLFKAPDNDPFASNDNWSDATDADEIAQAANQAGALPFEVGSKDAAVLITLQPGVYTAQVRGADGTTGVALVEAYRID